MSSAAPKRGAGARGGPRNRQGADTRQHLVRVAERLFSEQGIDRVSIRSVNTAAALGAASTHYHFGSKDTLVEAVVRDLGPWVRDRVVERTRRLAAQESAPSAVQLVELVAVPHLELLEHEPERGIRWVRIIAQLAMSDADVLARLYDEPTRAVFAQVRRAYPGVDDEQLSRRWALATRTLVQMMSHVDGRAPGDRITRSAELRRSVAELVGFVAGGVDALRHGA